MAKKSSNRYWIYGTHACGAAMDNPERTIHRAMLARGHGSITPDMLGSLPCEMADNKQFARLLGAEAIHQGIAIEVSPLTPPELMDAAEEHRPFIMLDQVSDPHNVGAILRSAAAFNAAGVIVHDRNAPRETGVMARAASGALEIVPLIPVTNLAHTLDELKQAGYWCIGLDGDGTHNFADVPPDPRSVIVLGAEGKGLRRLTAERCDYLAYLPMSEQMESLNVSNAAAIALYSLFIPHT